MRTRLLRRSICGALAVCFFTLIPTAGFAGPPNLEGLGTALLIIGLALLGVLIFWGGVHLFLFVSIVRGTPLSTSRKVVAMLVFIGDILFGLSTFGMSELAADMLPLLLLTGGVPVLLGVGGIGGLIWRGKRDSVPARASGRVETDEEEG